MPLRALLLMPSGEQPTNPPPKPTSSRFRRSQNASTPRIVSPQDLATARLSTSSQPHGTRSHVFSDSTRQINELLEEVKNPDRWSISSKPLPSPPPRPERESHQTYQTTLTLPSMSGSSSLSGTDHAPSPPLSPSPTSSRRSTGYEPEGSSTKPLALMEATVAEHIRASDRFMLTNSSTTPTLRLKLPSIPTELDERGRPILKLNTTLPRIGSAIVYTRSESYREEALSPESTGPSAVQPGEQTARKAVSDRIRHLVATTSQSEPTEASPLTAQLRFSFLSPLSSPSRAPSPTNSRPQSISPSTNRITATPSTLHPPVSNHHPARRKSYPRHYRIAPIHPPSAPTKGIPPFKILSEGDMLELLGDGYILGMTEGRKVAFERRKVNPARARRLSRPKGTKGKYIRLITLPPLVIDAIDEDIDGVNRGERPKGLQPSIRVEMDADFDEGETADTSMNSLVPTVYMTELLASQHDMPIACMMWPPLPADDVASASRATLRPLSGASIVNNTSHIRQDGLILPPPPKAYQFPLPHLTRTQRVSLQSAKLLVYAVPSQYIGPVPPPELEIIKEEVVAPWANAQFSTASSLVGVVAEEKESTAPRLAAFASGALSPRWGPTVEGLWSRSSSKATEKRDSSLSTRSIESAVTAAAMTDVGAGAGTAQAANNVVEETKATPTPPPPSSSSTDQQSTSGWSAGLSSWKSRAQGYYATRVAAAAVAATNEPSTPLTSSVSESAVASITIPVSPSATTTTMTTSLSPPPASATTSASASMTGSRSFGSFFSRSTSISAASSSSASSGSMVRLSSPLQHQVKVDDFGCVLGADSGSFVFEGEDLVPATTLGGAEAGGSAAAAAPAAAVVEPPATTTTTQGWRGWGARWGRSNQ
ncbi:hypothetical protein FRC17_006789 [Serendipita sp. 399]|nr:hypothetical protein FRC17_006789 [Serendipita sp. 399]